MDAQDRIKTMVTDNRVFLFMKGTPDFPQCGFSMKAVSIVKSFDVPYATFDVLSDPEIRQGVKTYANWPTIPQLYVGGELVGGSDILMEMWESGDLEKLIKS